MYTKFDRGLLGSHPDRTAVVVRKFQLAAAAVADQGKGVVASGPDDADALSTRGWAALSAGEPGQAVVHFRAALRLDPSSEWAREGIVAALKMRYWLYRRMYSFSLWLNGLGTGRRWGVIVGVATVLIIVQMVLGAVEKENPQLAPYTSAALYAILGFIVLTWVVDPLFNLLARLDPCGRLGLSPDQRKQSTWVAGCLGVVVAAALVRWFGDGVVRVAAEPTAVSFLLLMLPVSAIFRLPTGWPRRVMAVYAFGMLTAWGVMAWHFAEAGFAATLPEVKAHARAAWDTATGILWAGFLSGFVANLLASARR